MRTLTHTAPASLLAATRACWLRRRQCRRPEYLLPDQPVRMRRHRPAGSPGRRQPATPPTQPAPTRPPAAAISLVFSSSELGSAGLAGDEVRVTALVKTRGQHRRGRRADRVLGRFRLPGGRDAVKPTRSGKASAVLGTGGSRLNRPIKLSAQGRQRSRTSAVVHVVGTRLSMAGPSSLRPGRDRPTWWPPWSIRPGARSAAKPVTCQRQEWQCRCPPASAVSDSKGQVRMRLQGSQRGDEQVTVSAPGRHAGQAAECRGSELVLRRRSSSSAGGVETLKEIAVGTCSPLDGRYCPRRPAASP